MARPREFDTDAAIDGAMQVFWTHGFEDASLQLLLDGTGLSRGSLYKAFESKQHLFTLALQLYADREVWPAVALLEDVGASDGLDRIAKVFDAVPRSIASGEARGCLLCSAAAGRAAREEGIADKIQDLLGALQAAFATALQETNLAGNGTAHMLMTHYIGLRTLQRAGSSEADIRDNVDALLARLKP